MSITYDYLESSSGHTCITKEDDISKERLDPTWYKQDRLIKQIELTFLMCLMLYLQIYRQQCWKNVKSYCLKVLG